jgi:hypothetical protein
MISARHSGINPLRAGPMTAEQALELVPLFTALGLEVADDGDVVLPVGPLFGNHVGAGYALSIGAAMEAAGAMGLWQRVDLTEWAPITTSVDLRFISPALNAVRCHAEPVEWEMVAAQLAEPDTDQVACRFEIRAEAEPRYCAYGTVQYLLRRWSGMDDFARPARARRRTT